MAHSRSAKKRVRVIQTRERRNKSLRSQYKTYVTKAEKLIKAGDIGQAEEAVKQAISTLDKTARKRIIHRNNASRRKSQLVKKLAAARVQE
ncbi:MAG: 30S ribosomal protein S20 [Chloroflexota bacterium]|nr:30S ribosomal protein S20 [Chloroflexota bacterium]